LFRGIEQPLGSFLYEGNLPGRGEPFSDVLGAAFPAVVRAPPPGRSSPSKLVLGNWGLGEFATAVKEFTPGVEGFPGP